MPPRPATLALLSFLALAACAADDAARSPLEGSYTTAATIEIAPADGEPATLVIADAVMNAVSTMADDDDAVDVYFAFAQGAADCLFEATGAGAEVTLPDGLDTSCDVTLGDRRITLDGGTGHGARTGDLLTLELGGAYVDEGGEGTYAIRVAGTLVPGTAP
jgi:hypothetical protein